MSNENPVLIPVLILGALSDIGVAVGRAYAATGRKLILLARDKENLAREAEHLRLRYNATVETHVFDVLYSHTELLASLDPFPTTVISVVGLMGEQSASETDEIAADLVFRSNFSAPALFLQACANKMTAGGTIVGISSVAGDRGRGSNYFYGAAKAGFTAFLSGLRNRLAARGIHVITVKPGFVKTRMLEGMKTPAPLTAAPEEVARAILQAEAGRKNVIYVRPIWCFIMTIIKSIPEAIFKKLKL
jgi:short-subunit dehydrogenase